MGANISSKAEFEAPRRRSKPVEERARHLAQMKGGEVEDFYEQAEHELRQPREPFEYKDDDLVTSGFRLIKPYDYTDPKGGLLYQSVRYEHPNVPNAKDFRQRRKGPDGKWYADAGLVKVPYRWPDIVARPAETIYYVEGEKDADRLASIGLLATTMAGQQWSPEGAKAIKGRDVVVIGDKDGAGRENIHKAVDALRGFAKSIRVVDLPGLGRTEDISDWLDKGNTKAELDELIETAPTIGLKPRPTGLLDPTKIPLRRWLYKPYLIRQFVSLLVSTGGTGKSSLGIIEALAIVSGKPLLRIAPEEGRQRVWYWNGEDPIEELHRRVAAAQSHYQLTEDEIGDRLFIDSGRSAELIIAQEDKRVVRLNETVVDELVETIKANKIDVMIVDPFVSSHRVSENDNAAIDLVAKAWNRIAEAGNCAVMLVHHSRKSNGSDASVDDARGASALLAAARSARIIATMTKEEAQKCDIPERERRSYFSSYLGKANLTRPPEDRDWYKIETVTLSNGGFGDDVGVVTAWDFPKANVPKITETVIRRACDLIKAGGPWREDLRSKKEPWIGEPIAEVLGLDLASEVDKTAVKKEVARWIDKGILKRNRKRDAHRELRVYIEVAERMPTGGEDKSAADVASTAAPEERR